MAHSIRLVHWNIVEAAERAEHLIAAGFNVNHGLVKGAADLRRMGQAQFDAIVIDLSRLPSQGRDAGLALRKAKPTRRVPLIFVDGDKSAMQKVKRHLPDAMYTSWRGLVGTIERAITAPVMDPVVPSSNLAGYSGTPLPKKLGIKEGTVLALLDPPSDFMGMLGLLPRGAEVSTGVTKRTTLVICFVISRRALSARLPKILTSLGKGSLWIAWPKKTSGVNSDLSEKEVRRLGLAVGWVDYKVCAIDETWSGLLFTRRKTKRG